MKTVIFDMFGVIAIDPAANLMPFVKDKLKHFSDDEIEDIWLKAATGCISSHDFFKMLGFEGDIGKLEREYLDTVEVDESFFEATERLKGKGFRLALLSNDISEWSLYIRQKFNLDCHFDLVVISGECGLIKPDTRIFEHALSRLSETAENCVFIDDRVKNLDAAGRLGMDTILFDRSSKKHDRKSASSFRELCDLLTEINREG